MEPSDFEKLSEHLVAVDPLFEEFAARHGFSVQSTALGRYPRRRIVRIGEPSAYFDLQMDLTENGKHFSTFDPRIPYSMGVGAWVDEGNRRFGMSVWCFQGVPFQELLSVLPDELERGLALLAEWDVDYLHNHGEQTQIST